MGWPCWQAPGVSWLRNSGQCWWCCLCPGALLLQYPSLCWSQIWAVQSQRRYQGSALALNTETRCDQWLLISREVLQNHWFFTHSVIHFKFCQNYFTGLGLVGFYFVFFCFSLENQSLSTIYLIAIRVALAPECKQSHMSQRQFCGICHPIKQSTKRLEILKRQL